VTEVDATRAIARYHGPVLLAHGEADQVVPAGHLKRLTDAVRSARAGDPLAAPVETMLVPDGEHSWLYEDATYRRTVATFLARSLGGPLDPLAAGEIAAATEAWRLPDRDPRFAAVEAEPGGFRTLAQVVMPGATRAPADDRSADATAAE
jgi:dienelactone hydrolase